jgi:HD-GYP domain-containing protein (c-di-GMP phosphodiesterase class II)
VGKLYDISFSSGLATKETITQSIFEIQKSADEYLKNRKLFNRKSIRSNLISSIMATVYEKSAETEEHAQRIAVLSKMIGERLNLSANNIGELELFSMLHDIGKIGIDDRILKKPGKLASDEWIVMKTHTEIGYRIANSASELESIAEYILTHHERRDGKGYPQGLLGDEIPILSRIVAVADSYDAMTNDRVYRQAMSVEAAIEEIKNNSGTQFDPQIVAIFNDIIYTYLSGEPETTAP